MDCCSNRCWIGGVAAMLVNPIHERIAELWIKSHSKGLSAMEETEFIHCMKQNVKICWEYAYLKNMSLLASMINDISWQQEICLEIENKKYD